MVSTALAWALTPSTCGLMMRVASSMVVGACRKLWLMVQPEATGQVRWIQLAIQLYLGCCITVCRVLAQEVPPRAPPLYHLKTHFPTLAAEPNKSNNSKRRTTKTMNGESHLYGQQQLSSGSDSENHSV